MIGSVQEVHAMARYIAMDLALDRLKSEPESPPKWSHLLTYISYFDNKYLEDLVNKQVVVYKGKV
jgi:hypothetical protein